MTKHINWFPPPDCSHYYHTAPFKEEFDAWQIHFPQLSFLSVWWHDQYGHDGARYDSWALCEDCRQLVQVCLLRVKICISCLFKVYALDGWVFISVQVKLPQDFCNLRLLYAAPWVLSFSLRDKHGGTSCQVMCLPIKSWDFGGLCTPFSCARTTCCIPWKEL